MDILTLKDKATRLLGNYNFGIFVGDEKLLTTLQEIIDNEIPEHEIEILSKTLHNLENYLFTKSKFIIQKNDLEYLNNIANELRNQHVRINEQVPFSSPIFKVHIDEKNKEQNFSFITKEGAKKYIEYNSTLLKHLNQPDDNTDLNSSSDRRKKDLFDVENNTNLEMEHILEIIKRNF